MSRNCLELIFKIPMRVYDTLAPGRTCLALSLGVVKSRIYRSHKLLLLPLFLVNVQALGQSLRGSTQTNPVVYSDTTWQLVWSDEFTTDGPPDPKNWQFENGFVRNHEHQWYQAENANCKNGLLIIEGKREQRPNPTYRAGSDSWRTSRPTIEYTSSSINTNGLHQWQYGRFEMRGRIDTRPGLWPAFWTLGVAGEWPLNGEVDIMEYYRNQLLANVAWGSGKRYTAKWRTVKKPMDSFNDPDWSKKFHVWRMDWDKTAIQLYVDDQLLNSVQLTETINQDGTSVNPFHKPHYILLNLAIGGDNGGEPSETIFPGKFEVDYIRIYQQRSVN